MKDELGDRGSNGMGARVRILYRPLAVLLWVVLGLGLAASQGGQASASGAPGFVAACPVSARPSPTLPPAVVDAGGRHWIGSHGLWVRTAIRAYGGFWSPADKAYLFKLAWYRQQAGRISVVGKMSGATRSPQPHIRTAWSSYPAPGVLPSTLVFKEQGCWKVTARQSKATVTFTVAVYNTPRR